tara:strand:- start:1193 stop:1390 length:198 start_codon:yes stop_codon:yes gene_type:complete
MSELDLRLFFEMFDKDDPYHLSAVGELYSEIRQAAPELLSPDAEWFHTWKWGGKRCKHCGEKING